MPAPIRVVVADRSRAVRLLLASLLQEDPRFEIVADVDSSSAILEHVAGADLVVLGLALECGDGLSAIEQLHALAPRVASVVVSDVDVPYLRAEAAARGAAGFFTNDTDGDVLLDEIAAAVAHHAAGRAT